MDSEPMMPCIMQITVFREDDGRYFAEYLTGNGLGAGGGNGASHRG
jgi:hypothetical protein